MGRWGAWHREGPRAKDTQPERILSSSIAYTEDSEDASGPKQLQAPLVVGGAVVFVGVHHCHVEGAGLARSQELVLRGREGQMRLSPKAPTAGSPCPSQSRCCGLSGTLASSAPALLPCIWLYTVRLGCGRL